MSRTVSIMLNDCRPRLVSGAVALISTLSCTLIFTVILAFTPLTGSERAADGETSVALQHARMMSEAFAEITAMVSPAVVHIKVTSAPARQQPMSDNPFFRRFGVPQTPQPRQGQGSGVIIAADGRILTNHHVIENATTMEVVMADGRSYAATLVGSDPASDLAVLDIEADNLPVAQLGASSQLRSGEWVLAMGSPFGLQASVTSGIVSAVGRDDLSITNYEDFIQTDAAINPGNSGGPLVDLHGKVIGINTAIFSRSGGSMGIGFAIPIDFAKPIINQLTEFGNVRRGFLGVGIQDVDATLAEALGLPQQRGALVSQVMPSGPADRAGLEIGDVIIQVDNNTIGDANELRNSIAAITPGAATKLTVMRGDRQLDLSVTLAQRDDDPVAARVTPTATGGWGMELSALDEQANGERVGSGGVLISRIASDSPASKAGMQPGMILLRVGRQAVNNVEDAYRLMTQAGNQVALLIEGPQGIRYMTLEKS